MQLYDKIFHENSNKPRAHMGSKKKKKNLELISHYKNS